MTDELILLLSTDWFLPHWSEIGIDIAEAKKLAIQLGCRKIIDEILEGAESFFLCDFSEERIQETKGEFLELLRRCDAVVESSAAFDMWANLTHRESTSAVMVSSLNREVDSTEESGRGPQLPSHIRTEVKNTWDTYALDPTIFREVCLNSETVWDVRAQRLLNSPQSLVNQLWSFLLGRRVRSFWEKLRERLTREELMELVSWYCAKAKSIGADNWPGPLVPYHIWRHE
jgi:hypothetical protein